jgi:hypothetical protein
VFEHLGVVVEEYDEGASLACELLQSVWDDTGMDGMKERMIMEWEPDADLTSIMGQKETKDTLHLIVFIRPACDVVQQSQIREANILQEDLSC